MSDVAVGPERKRGFLRSRWLTFGGLVVVAVLLGVFGAAYAYARTRDDVIAPGIRAGAVDLGGLSATVARAKLEQAYRPLERPLVVRAGRREVVLTARAAGVAVDTNTVVAQALAISRRPWFLARAWRELTGGREAASLRPPVRYSRAAVEHVVRELQRQIDRTPRNARVVPSFDRLSVTRSRPGVAVAARALRHAIERALVSPRARRVIAVPLLHPRPRVTVAVLRRRYPSFVTIDRGAFRLRVYSHLRFVRAYPIAVGQQGLQTPAGLYHVQNKVVNPSWQVPFSSWTGSLAGQVIPPGPDDPLKARWLGIFNGAGIHGTDETWSIGHAVSHGCVRMTIPDVIDLYGRVRVGTPVYIGD
jgi:lipoprotein-anchoring transpeptidase ErfK/SrfK